MTYLSNLQDSYLCLGTNVFLVTLVVRAAKAKKQKMVLSNFLSNLQDSYLCLGTDVFLVTLVVRAAKAKKQKMVLSNLQESNHYLGQICFW